MPNCMHPVPLFRGIQGNRGSSCRDARKLQPTPCLTLYHQEQVHQHRCEINSVIAFTCRMCQVSSAVPQASQGGQGVLWLCTGKKPLLTHKLTSVFPATLCPDLQVLQRGVSGWRVGGWPQGGVQGTAAEARGLTADSALLFLYMGLHSLHLSSRSGVQPSAQALDACSTGCTWKFQSRPTVSFFSCCSWAGTDAGMPPVISTRLLYRHTHALLCFTWCSGFVGYE